MNFKKEDGYLEEDFLHSTLTDIKLTEQFKSTLQMLEVFMSAR